MRFGIPFNIPHGLKITELAEDKGVAKIPKIKTNLNHLGTIHACAMATIGEYVAGVLILKNFKATKVRVVLTNMQIEYLKQGTSALHATATISSELRDTVNSALEQDGKALLEMESVLTDNKDQVVSVVKSSWQVKNWKDVSSKF